MRKVIIDCDPGHDDVMAIIETLAHPDSFELLGITTVCGNNLCELVTENVLHVLEWIGRSDIPVARGALKPLFYDPAPQEAHGYNGLEGFDFPESVTIPVSLDAPAWIHDHLQKSKTPVTIMALAPMTNIALLLSKWPEDSDKIKEIVMMGGSVHGGNVLKHAEFNVYGDPQALKEVAETNIPITILPLEACNDCTISEQEISDWKNDSGRIAQMAGALLDFFAEDGRREGVHEVTVFDLGVPYYLLYPNRFSYSMHAMEVVTTGKETRGQTVFTDGNRVKVLEHTDTSSFRKEIITCIKKLDRALEKN